MLLRHVCSVAHFRRGSEDVAAARKSALVSIASTVAVVGVLCPMARMIPNFDGPVTTKETTTEATMTNTTTTTEYNNTECNTEC